MDDSEKRVKPVCGTRGVQRLWWSAGDLRLSLVAWPKGIGAAGKAFTPLLVIAFAVIAPGATGPCSRVHGGEPGGLRRLPAVDDSRVVSIPKSDTMQFGDASRYHSHARIPESLWHQQLVQPSSARLSSSIAASGVGIRSGGAEGADIAGTWEPTGAGQLAPARGATVATGTPGRQMLARMVSAGILQTPDPSHLQLPNRAVAAPLVRSHSVTSQQQLAIAADAADKAQELALKGAVYGARQQARDALVALAVAADIESSRMGREEQAVACDLVEGALQALREAGDFVGRFGTVDEAGCARMVMSHETPVLKSCSQQMTGHEAAGYYLDYARQNLATALRNQPAASRVLVLLGQCEASCEENPETLRSGIQLCCFRAAITVDPADADLLVHFGSKCVGSGLISEGQWAFERAVMLNGDSRAASALLEIYARTGNQAGVATMRARIASGNPPTVSTDQTVFLMTPQQFASISPPVQQGAIQESGPLRRDLRPFDAADSYARNASPREIDSQQRIGHFDAGRGQHNEGASGQGTQRAVGAEQQGGPEAKNGFWGRVAGQLRWAFQ